MMGAPATPSGSRASHGTADGVSTLSGFDPSRERMRHVPVYLREQTIEALGLIADYGRISRASVIRTLVEQHVEEAQKRAFDAARNRLPVEAQSEMTKALIAIGAKTHKSRVQAEPRKLLEQALAAIDSGRSEPLYIMRDAIRNWLDDNPAIAMEARQGRNREDGSDPKDDSAAPSGDRP